jgi:hypothetical protein
MWTSKSTKELRNPAQKLLGSGMTKDATEVRWIVKYGPELECDREQKVVYDEKSAMALFKKYQDKNFHVDVYKQSTKIVTEKLT